MLTPGFSGIARKLASTRTAGLILWVVCCVWPMQCMRRCNVRAGTRYAEGYLQTGRVFPGLSAFGLQKQRLGLELAKEARWPLGADAGMQGGPLGANGREGRARGPGARVRGKCSEKA